MSASLLLEAEHGALQGFPRRWSKHAADLQTADNTFLAHG
jgi:hypothetical protein